VKPYFISLWHAAKQGDLDMTRQLVNDGESIHELSVFLRNSPLHLAVINCHYLLVRLLLETKASTDCRNKDGVTPPEYAEIIYEIVNKASTKIEDYNEIVDLRNFVRPVLNKPEKVLNASICEKNFKVKFWQVNDFSTKIYNLLFEGNK